MVAMSTARIGERRERGAHARRRDGRDVALHVDDDLGVAADRGERFVDARRAVDDDRGGSSTASPPAPRTAAAISGASVATTTRPISASTARRQTWTIIGSPAMSASGLPGQAGRRHAGGDRERSSVTGLDGAARVAKRPKVRRLYGLPPRRQSPSFARRHLPGRCRGSRNRGTWTPYEFNKIAGAVLGTAFGVMAIGIIAGIIYAPSRRRRSRATRSPSPNGGGEAAGGRRPRRARRSRCASPRPTPKAGETSAKNCLACHTLAKGQPAKVGPEPLWRRRRTGGSHGGLQIFGGHARPEGRRGSTGRSRTSTSSSTAPQRVRAGNRHGIRRPEETRPARQRHRLPQRQLRFAAAAAASGRGPGRRPAGRGRGEAAAGDSLPPPVRSPRQPNRRSRNRRHRDAGTGRQGSHARLTPEKAPAGGVTPAPAK